MRLAMRGTGKPYDKDSTDSGPRDNRAPRESLFEPYEIGAGHRDHLHHHQGDDEFPSCLCLFDAEFQQRAHKHGPEEKGGFQEGEEKQMEKRPVLPDQFQEFGGPCFHELKLNGASLPFVRAAGHGTAHIGGK